MLSHHVAKKIRSEYSFGILFRGMAESEQRVLSYGDVLLRRCDVELLEGPHFLNDNIIEFFFAYISPAAASPILMISPSTSFWIMNCPNPGDLQPVLSPLDLPSRQMVLFPINNNDEVGMAGGGSHWSLLVYHRAKNLFAHFDSMGGANQGYARHLFRTVKQFMGGAASTGRYCEASSPQQQNGYDCGVYVMAIAKALKQGFEEGGDTDLADLVKRKVTAESVSSMRQTTLQLIRSLSSRSSSKN